MNGLIDIQLVATQILGFILFAFILSRMLWKPLLAFLESRRQKIAGEFAEADRRKTEADGLRTKYEAELRTIDAQARQKLNDALSEGQRVAGEIRQQAQKDAQSRLERAEDEIQREREKAKELLKQQVVTLSLRTAEKILRQKLDDPAQRKLAGEFVDEVAALK
jgi:F-type H+-transporting ATPase subunit b